MTGGWSSAPQKHSRILFNIGGGEAVYFNDIRNFGTVTSATRGFTAERLWRLGLDPLGQMNGLVESDFANIVHGLRHRPNLRLAEFLLDQRYVCGIGNYGRAEILYAARLSPWRPLSRLSPYALDKLRLAINEIQWASYRAGGASLSSWYAPDGTRGTFQEQFKVYGRSSCPAGTPVLSQADFNGRRMWWVPAVQGPYQSGQCS